MLYDVLGHSVGSEHTYYISSDNLKNLFEEEVLKSYLKDVVVEEVFITVILYVSRTSE